MATIDERSAGSQKHAVEIVEDTLRVLKTRDGIAIPDDLISERARNVVTALEGEFDIEPRPPLPELASWETSMARLKASAEVLRAMARRRVS